MDCCQICGLNIVKNAKSADSTPQVDAAVEGGVEGYRADGARSETIKKIRIGCFVFREFSSISQFLVPGRPQWVKVAHQNPNNFTVAHPHPNPTTILTCNYTHIRTY
jgi:hypothetical protein